MRDTGSAVSEIRRELNRLITTGHELQWRELLARGPDETTHASREQLEKEAADKADSARAEAAKERARRLLKTPNFSKEYQSWYTSALRALQHLLPERYDEFRSLYRLERRKAMNVETYGIADYIAGLYSVANGLSQSETLSIALQKFEQQITILESAEPLLDSVVADISGTLQAALLDEELASSRVLLRADHIRSAGVVAGVVLEAHLKRVASERAVKMRKKPTLANLNDALKEAGVYDVPQWRRIAYLGDIRNLCAHSGDRAPQSDEVEDLIDGVDKVVHTIF